MEYPNPSVWAGAAPLTLDILAGLPFVLLSLAKGGWDRFLNWVAHPLDFVFQRVRLLILFL